MKTSEAWDLVGGLSKPSKMPGWAYGIPAKEYNKKRITSWAIQVEWDNGEVENITALPSGVAHEVEEFLTDLENAK